MRTHARALPNPDSLLGKRSIGVHKAEIATTSRDNHVAASKAAPLNLRFEQHAVQISPTPMGDLPITYVGHSPVQQVTVHNSYVYIDTDVCVRTAKRAADSRLTIVEHHKFAHWLGGVAAARGGAGLPVRPLAAPDTAGPVPTALAWA